MLSKKWGVAAIFFCLMHMALADSEAVVNGTASSVEQLGQLARSYLNESQFSLGLAAQQATLTLNRTGARAQMTDNGTVTLLVSADSRGHPLWQIPLQRHGDVNLAWDWTATGNWMGLHRQLLNQANVGSNIGTSVQGGFLAAGIRLNLGMGPLYNDSSIFWRYSLALGPGVMRYQGHSLFEGSAASSTPVSVGGRWMLTDYVENRWELVIDRWELLLNAQYLQGQSQGLHTWYMVVGLGAAYRFSW